MGRRFGIEFAPEVVQADGTVRNLAWRICNAKKVLVCCPAQTLGQCEAGPVAHVILPLRHASVPAYLELRLLRVHSITVF